jgi:hypothetical protein
VGPKKLARAQRITAQLIDAFAAAGLRDALDEGFDVAGVAVPADADWFDAVPDAHAAAMLAGLAERGARSVFVRHLQRLGGHPSRSAVLAAIAATLSWGPLMRKRVSRLTVECLPGWLRLMGVMIGASVEAARHEPAAFCGVPAAVLLGRASITEVAYRALLGSAPKPRDLLALTTLIGLLLSNGPGTITGQGVKGAVSSDGPEQPERVQLNKAMLGFLSHCGYAHGGNGFEGVAFLIEQFRDVDLADPGNPEHGIDLKALASAFVERYAAYKTEKKNIGAGDMQKIPCVNHPVFKDRPVNTDPREAFIRERLAARGEHNVFLDYYHALVEQLYEAGVSRNVYCVNVDAVIATLLLGAVWGDLRAGRIGAPALETAAFTVFLYARMLGSAAEADDHLNRGRNMDTRTAASACRFVA